MLDALSNGWSLPVGLAVIGALLAFFGRESLMSMIVGCLMIVIGVLFLAALVFGIDQGLVMSILLLVAAVVFVVFSFMATEHRQVLFGLALLCGVIGGITLFRPTIGDSQAPLAQPLAMKQPAPTQTPIALARTQPTAIPMAPAAGQQMIQVQGPDGSLSWQPYNPGGQPAVVVVQPPPQVQPTAEGGALKFEFPNNDIGREGLDMLRKGAVVQEQEKIQLTPGYASQRWAEYAGVPSTPMPSATKPTPTADPNTGWHFLLGLAVIVGLIVLWLKSR